MVIHIVLRKYSLIFFLLITSSIVLVLSSTEPAYPFTPEQFNFKQYPERSTSPNLFDIVLSSFLLTGYTGGQTLFMIGIGFTHNTTLLGWRSWLHYVVIVFALLSTILILLTVSILISTSYLSLSVRSSLYEQIIEMFALSVMSLIDVGTLSTLFLVNAQLFATVDYFPAYIAPMLVTILYIIAYGSIYLWLNWRNYVFKRYR